MIVLATLGVEWATDHDIREIPHAMERLNPVLLLTLTSILPILGFPVSVTYLVLGAKFGPYWGFVAVSGITVVHLLGTHLVANSFLREPVQRWLARRKHKVPEVPPGEGIAIVVVAILVPVLPYFIRNTLLALSGIPLRICLLVGVPLYTMRSGVTLFLGDLTGSPSRKGLLILGAIYLVKLAICAVLVGWIRRRHRKKPGRGPAGAASSAAPALAEKRP